MIYAVAVGNVQSVHDRETTSSISRLLNNSNFEYIFIPDWFFSELIVCVHTTQCHITLICISFLLYITTIKCVRTASFSFIISFNYPHFALVIEGKKIFDFSICVLFLSFISFYIYYYLFSLRMWKMKSKIFVLHFSFGNYSVESVADFQFFPVGKLIQYSRRSTRSFGVATTYLLLKFVNILWSPFFFQKIRN